MYTHAYSLLCVSCSSESVVPESINHLIGFTLAHVAMFYRALHPQVTRHTLSCTLTFQHVIFCNLRHIDSGDLS